MLYIVIALKTEAQAFVDKYRLNKSKLESFTIYTNSDMTIIVSGIGNINAQKATKRLIEHFNIGNTDTLVNIGICAASIEYDIGELVEISSVNYEGKEYILNSSKTNTINCFDEELYEQKYELVDMESFGFYKASEGIEKLYMYKIVSDHFEPQKVTKDGAKSLIFNRLKDIMKKVKI